jgi:hypothetical protein
MRGFVLLLAPVLAAGCTAAETVSPELACQRRLAAAREAPAAEGDEFNHQAYAALDKTGCTAKQLAVLDQILILTTALPGLTQANNIIGTTGDKAGHSAAFQKMNDSVIELNELERAVRSDLAQMEPPQ